MNKDQVRQIIRHAAFQLNGEVTKGWGCDSEDGDAIRLPSGNRVVILFNRNRGTPGPVDPGIEIVHELDPTRPWWPAADTLKWVVESIQVTDRYFTFKRS